MLSPEVERCAKQIYTHLSQRERIANLTEPLESLPEEIQKMNQLHSLKPDTLNIVARHFLQWKPKDTQKSIKDLISRLDSVISGLRLNDTLPSLTLQPNAVHVPQPLEVTTSSLSNTKSIYCSSPTSAHTIPTINGCNILCSPETNVLASLPWILKFDIGRFLLLKKLTFSDIPNTVIEEILSVGKKEPREVFSVMIKWYETRKLTHPDTLSYAKVEQCPEVVWNCTETYVKNRSVRYFGTVFLSSKTPALTLRVPKTTASNRLFRKFGDDRFLEFKLLKNSRPTTIKDSLNYFLTPLLFMNRVFRFLFIKEDRLVFFATEGEGLQPISIRQVVNWHIPLKENAAMTISKFASRMSLGYSNSTSTVVFQADMIKYIDDIHAQAEGEEETVMTDGCGIISCAAMRKIMGSQYIEELPCAIQGRIAGAKGVWILTPEIEFESGEWIKIRASQNKFKTCLPQADMDYQTDPIHFTFDLVKTSICIYPSKLNTQFIQAISAGGVPKDAFTKILHEYLQKLVTIVLESKNIKVLRDWVIKTGAVMNARWEVEAVEQDVWRDTLSDTWLTDYAPTEDTLSPDILTASSGKANYWRYNAYSGLPASLYDSAVRMIDSGFDLTNPFLANKITNIFRDTMRMVMSKYRIEVQQSCTLTCVPDPTGMLEEGEIFFQLSRRRVDEKSAIKSSIVLGDVLVTRNPCGLKSDVQKVTAVDCPGLRMYTDIVIFPVKGLRSLASKLSGGDYDGDIVFCCWDERLVKPFTNSPILPTPEKAKAAFEQNMNTISQVVFKHTEDTFQERMLQENFISVAIPDGILGKYDNWRTNLAEDTSFDNEDVNYLAHMCARLVDASKQGLTIKPSVLQKDRSDFLKIPQSRWFSDKVSRQREKDIHTSVEEVQESNVSNRPSTTTMDFLHETLLAEVEKFTRYSESVFQEKDVKLKDSALERPWLEAMAMAIDDKDAELQADLKAIQSCVDKNIHTYTCDAKQLWLRRQQKFTAKHDPGRKSETFYEDEDQFNTAFELEEHAAKEFHHFPDPVTFASSVFHYDLEINHGMMIQKIKASYAYIKTIQSGKFSKYCYVVAYDALRRIKADSCGNNSRGLCESVVPSIFQALNVDKYWI
ncbi:RNA-dependent RNA polymerase RdRP [Phycomyces blakesleeanus]|uniref:RNA-dependent RNA polymerase n=2 Tax=Phycomyces blakesleeanus TaxID=4837 RepID=A0A163ABK2_PHYB8|nr:RNA-dependent RNA polymerase RdRP [Phycomyces blakesleeanus NRRL 1555(-)]OAD72381.1 RNA-dependent RNA polymerase RdRP [Phycomyces blakesleeanus NRRL 1555(-)]|eukprot:XP_018290421.1 RNA-dependent RNA polymerase RdRP [Phycomyces blakesleeanus NRRL 1555(-)]